MKKALICLSAAALLGATPVALADSPKCKFHNLLTSFDDIEFPYLEDHPDYACARFSVRGTLTGKYTSCLVPDPEGAEFEEGPPSNYSIFALGPWEGDMAYSLYWDEWIETKDGTLHVHSYGVTFFDTGDQAGLSKIIPDEGSTGKFAGATGQLTQVTESGSVRITGTICTP